MNPIKWAMAPREEKETEHHWRRPGAGGGGALGWDGHLEGPPETLERRVGETEHGASRVCHTKTSGTSVSLGV